MSFNLNHYHLLTTFTYITQFIGIIINKNFLKYLLIIIDYILEIFIINDFIKAKIRLKGIEIYYVNYFYNITLYKV